MWQGEGDEHKHEVRMGECCAVRKRRRRRIREQQCAGGQVGEGLSRKAIGQEQEAC